MKRTIPMLGALAVVAGFLLTAPAAHAVTCLTITSGTPWPKGPTVVYCGTANFQKAQLMFNQLNGFGALAGNLKTQLINKNAPFYFFWNHAEYDSFFDGPPYVTHPEPTTINPPFTGDFPIDAWGVSYTPSGTGQFSAVFQRDGLGNDNPHIAETTAHEAGHWADWIYKALPSGGASLVSSSTLWTGLYNKDVSNLNAKNACKLPPPQNTSGVFTGKKDYMDRWICTSNGTGTTLANYSAANPPGPNYAGLADNLAIMKAAFPGSFTAGAEIFSDEVVVRVGAQSDPHFTYISGYFDCTKRLVQDLVVDGTLPTQAEMAAVRLFGQGAVGGANCPVTGLPLQ